MVCADNDHFYPGRKLPLGKFPGTMLEQRDLTASLVTHMGLCDCHPGMTESGRIAIHVCDAHWFLLEEDKRCTRTQRLLFARRQRHRWQSGEFGALLERTDDESQLGW